MKDGLMFPGVTHVLVTRKSDGATQKVSHASMKKTLKKKDFERLSHEVFMFGEFEDSKHKVTIATQKFRGPYKDTFI